MIRNSFLLLAITVVPAAWGDVSWEQSARVTGGAVAELMTGSSGQQKSTLLVKGSRMAMRNAAQMTVADLDAKTITRVDFAKKTYSVLTFDEMRWAYQEMMKRMQAPGVDAGLQPKVGAEETGRKKVIGGVETRGVVTKVELGGAPGAETQKVVTETWLAPEIAGYEEVRLFYRRMAETAGWLPGHLAPPQSGAAKGMVQAASEMTKVKGLPVLQTTTVWGPDGGASILEVTTEMSRYSTAPVDAAKMAVPAGFKKVPDETLNMLDQAK